MNPQTKSCSDAQEQFLSAEQLANRYNTCKATIYRWAAAGKLPKSVRLSSSCIRWKLSELLKFEQGA